MKTRDDILARVEQIRRINDNNATPIKNQTRADVCEWVLEQLESESVDFDDVWRSMDFAMDAWHHNRRWMPARVSIRLPDAEPCDLTIDMMRPGTMEPIEEPEKPAPPISPRTGKPKRKYTRRKRAGK